MEGVLGDVSLADLLQVVGIGRQYTGIELRQDDHSPAGMLFVKSGKLISAVAKGVLGKEAFFRLFPDTPARTFHVFRTDVPAALPEPIGAIGPLLLEAIDRDTTAARSVPPPKPASDPSSTPLSNPQAPRPKSRAPEPSVAARAERRPRRAAGTRAPVVAVASPKGGCGKTTIALNLALALARRERRVILVDADLNGDVLSSIDARSRARYGAFDALLGRVPVEEALLDTVIPHFKILPAAGLTLPRVEVTLHDHGALWRALLDELRGRADIVLVDTPAGMLGITHQVLRACTHVLGVLQAEVIAQRSFSMFEQGLSALPESERPRVLGVVLNMVQVGQSASVSVLQKACAELPGEWLLETSIPRSPAFLEATEAGVPLRMIDEDSPPAVSWLFETLAAEALQRLRLSEPERRPQRLLI
ncbi:MAG: AAA family ATPase [Polyangiales bacterium]